MRREFGRIVESERLGKEGLGMEGFRVDMKVDFESRATRFDAECIRCVEDASRDLFGKQYEELTQPLTSGAGWFLFSPTLLSCDPLARLHLLKPNLPSLTLLFLTHAVPLRSRLGIHIPPLPHINDIRAVPERRQSQPPRVLRAGGLCDWGTGAYGECVEV